MYAVLYYQYFLIVQSFDILHSVYSTLYGNFTIALFYDKLNRYFAESLILQQPNYFGTWTEDLYYVHVQCNTNLLFSWKKKTMKLYLIITCTVHVLLCTCIIILYSTYRMRIHTSNIFGSNFVFFLTQQPWCNAFLVTNLFSYVFDQWCNLVTCMYKPVFGYPIIVLF